MKSQDVNDPVLSEVIANLLLAVADEMAATMMRAAHSPNVRERGDCSTAVFDVHGQVVAQAPRVPLHLASMEGLIRELTKRFPRETLTPDDIFVANDPYNGGGSHLPDITMVTPVFSQEILAGFVANIAHHADVGGMVPGSESTACTSIFQEGLRLPPVRIRPEAGDKDDIFQVILVNSRTPDERRGDLQAQLAALRVGVRGMNAVLERYGLNTVQSCAENYMAYSERRMRQAIRRLKPGNYRFRDTLDYVGWDETKVPVPIACAATIENEHIKLDFRGTGPQMLNGKNVPLNATRAVAYCVVKQLFDPDIPSNSGTYRAVEVTAPSGSVLNPVPPAAIGERASSASVLGDVIVGVLAKADPGRELAPSGPHSLIIMDGIDPRTGKAFVDYQTVAGAYGARAYWDGIDAVRIHACGSANLPIESLELSFPTRITRYQLINDGGGAGSFRGGMPVRRDIQVLADGITLSFAGERQEHPPGGLNGGLPGRPGMFILNPDTPHEKTFPSIAADVRLQKGDVISVQTAGGGGFGSPLGRDIQLVQSDVRDQRISLQKARDIYGVVLKKGVIDARATDQLRHEMRRSTKTNKGATNPKKARPNGKLR